MNIQIPSKTEVESTGFSRYGTPVKWFHNLGPQSLGNVAAVSMQCMISDQDALRCIKELHNDQLIRTVTHAAGDWNGQYAITPQGRQCVERFGT